MQILLDHHPCGGRDHLWGIMVHLVGDQDRQRLAPAGGIVCQIGKVIFQLSGTAQYHAKAAGKDNGTPMRAGQERGALARGSHQRP